jgi:hypothetical protein
MDTQEPNVQELACVVRQLLTERFPTNPTFQVSIRADTDNDGNGILRIVVVPDQDPTTLDREAIAGFVRHLRPRLAQVRNDLFPIMSFVSKRDADKLQLEPL